MAVKHKKRLTPLRVVIGSILILVIAVLGFWLLLLDKNVAVLNPQGIIATQQKDLIIFTTLLSVIVVVPVFAMLGIFAWKYRAGNTGATYTPDADGNRWLELLWWGIPVLIIAILSVVTWVSTHDLDPQKSIASDTKPLKVQVVALQWKWLFIYPEEGLATVNELRMPVGRTVDFRLTADAPMSAFWIPNLGTQVYAMSGMSSKLSLRADKEGTYRGSNSNINGSGYADMHFNAVAMPQDEFESWAQATALKSDGQGEHMDWGVYENLAKPTKKHPAQYYHLHDVGLYDKVVQKYMPSGHGAKKEDPYHAHDQKEER